jgi:hypothetical protein
MIKFSDRSAAHRLRRESSGTLGSECSRVTPSEGRRRQEEIVQNVAPVLKSGEVLSFLQTALILPIFVPLQITV